ncbi:polysaccharide deacetylase family protein [Tumebacillus permanentifrigoris]|uniref:Putative sporulation protein (Polysaccharide deacetylase family) n=1 Tax=Tumebacillus permanentifrigoris TaxID=378543 RepID=A0A316D7E9_9BACL|nr:polysaccharide deacetylase family protein [Tumebacillus permanentifrigoris]PWK12659.1 putative sporulation protein (polysaccharide deacetylase family) [Tumebacillus permanentifrigoris]
MNKQSKPILTIKLARGRLLAGVATGVLLVGGFFLTGQQGEPDAKPTLAVVSAMAGASPSGSLEQRVQLLEKLYNADPIDARNDPVWKGVPELNGLKVDVEATIKQAQKAMDGRIPLVAKQIPPNVTLNDLGAVPIYRGNPEKKQMALMINVAWGTEYIEDLLKTLDEFQVKATFFLDGSWTADHPGVAKQIVVRGHEIGNHAYSHPDMSHLDAGSQRSQITRTNEVIKKATGQTPTLFAPPSGAYNETTVKTAHGQKLRTILWTLDTVDWKKPPASVIEDRVLSRAENGALVLMHPTEPTRDALRTILQGLQKKGYGLVTVSTLLDPVRPLPTP